jgi:hypothetical protein
VTSSNVPASIFSPGVAALYGAFLPPTTLRAVARVARATDRQHAQAATDHTHGFRIFQLGVALGLGAAHASRCGVTMDALQIAIDLLDNVTDEDLDASEGRDWASAYRGIPRETLTALPSLLIGCVVASLPLSFPPREHPTAEATTFLLGVLDRMARGQGLALTHPERVDCIAGEAGRLYTLPLRLAPSQTVEVRRRTEAVDRWGFEFGRYWQLEREVVERPRARRWVPLRGRALGRTRAAWPTFPPFSDGGLFARAAFGL